ncbi:MAG: cyclic nucleotide-binding domain-containing protein [Acidobacteriota bacterium]
MAADPFKDLTIHRKKDETIYREGDLGSEMYVVQSGAVRIYREYRGTIQELAIMEKGDFFGEFAVLEGLPRTASAVALEESDLIEINSTTFDKMIRSNIEIAVRMLRKLSNRLQEANRKIELLSRAAASGKPVAEAVSAIDTDQPAEAPPPAPEAPPSEGVEAEPRPIADVDVPEGALALLVLEGGERHFPITGETALIGRYDPVTGTRPEIDLTQVDINRSVSRRHARIVSQDGQFRISEEVGALNGTFVNGQRLTAGEPVPVKSGDTVALGMVSFVFKTAGGGKAAR